MKLVDELVFYRNLVSTYFYVNHLTSSYEYDEKMGINFSQIDYNDFYQFVNAFNSYVKMNSIDISAFALRVLNEKRAEERSNKKSKKGGKK